MRQAAPTERFSNTAADPLRYRRGYPPALRDGLSCAPDLPAEAAVAAARATPGAAAPAPLEAAGPADVLVLLFRHMPMRDASRQLCGDPAVDGKVAIGYQTRAFIGTLN